VFGTIHKFRIYSFFYSCTWTTKCRPSTTARCRTIADRRPLLPIATRPAGYGQWSCVAVVGSRAAVMAVDGYCRLTVVVVGGPGQPEVADDRQTVDGGHGKEEE